MYPLAAVSASTSVANLACYYPLYLPESFTFDTVLTVNNSNAPAGNFDFGIYSSDTFARIVSLGSTAVLGSASIRQEYAITETVLPAGAYYMAVVKDSATTGTFQRVDLAASTTAAAYGLAFQASAFPLPNPMVPLRTAAQNPFLYRVGVRQSGAGF